MNDSAMKDDAEPEAAEFTWRDKAAMIAPLLIFFASGAFVDTSPVRDGELINGPAYFTLVVVRVVLMAAAFMFFAKAILRQFPLVIDRWGWIVGVVGAVIWIGVCALDLERAFVSAVGLGADWLPQREGVNPMQTYSAGGELIGFLGFRFTLLVLCVPIAEELFLRGFVMRAFESEDWVRLRLADIGRTGLIVGTFYGVLTHPSECIAAALWFSMVSVLMVRTGKFWNCVVAHAVTNLLLGLYVCLAGAWHLW